MPEDSWHPLGAGGSPSFRMSWAAPSVPRHGPLGFLGFPRTLPLSKQLASVGSSFTLSHEHHPHLCVVLFGETNAKTSIFTDQAWQHISLVLSTRRFSPPPRELPTRTTKSQKHDTHKMGKNTRSRGRYSRRLTPASCPVPERMCVS